MRLTAGSLLGVLQLGDGEQGVRLQCWAAELQHCQDNSDIHLDTEKTLLSLSRQGKLICIAQFNYKVIQSALQRHKTEEIKCMI